LPRNGAETGVQPQAKKKRSRISESIDMFFGPYMLDVVIQKLTRQAAEFAGIIGTGVNGEDLVAQVLNASGKAASEATLSRLPGDLKRIEGDEYIDFLRPDLRLGSGCL